MVDKSYWVECFPVSQNDNIGDHGEHLYTASIDVLPQVTCTGDSVSQVIDKLRQKLITIQATYYENGVSLPRSHSLSCPTHRHRKEKDWMSVYLTINSQE
ncbi:MAG: hypothetical protein ACPG05_00985 [Bdellovibrionales bacterium]